MDMIFYEIIGFGIGIALTALIAFLKYKGLDATDSMAMVVIKNGRLLVDSYSAELIAYDKKLYDDVVAGLKQCEELLVDEELDLTDAVKAIITFGPIFVDAAKKIGIHDKI